MGNRDYLDLLVVVPLEEELHQFMEVFQLVEDRSTDTEFRCLVHGEDPTLKTLVVQQEEMGKSNAARAISRALQEWDAGAVICVGIAGALSDDLRLGDVCYSGTVIDIYDNAKALDGAGGDIDFQFSPTFYLTPREITAAFNFVRILPDLKPKYEAWQNDRKDFASRLVPGAFVGRNQLQETVGLTQTKNGTIVCGAVSKSAKYNKKLLAIDRKILAIETESGGVFEEAKSGKVPALTIRGISDYADSEKNSLEAATKGAFRKIAAANAASFLRLQMNNGRFVHFLHARRQLRTNADPGGGSTLVTLPSNDIMSLITDVGQDIDAKLRELSPEFRLQPKGYRLPVPRVRRINYSAGMGEAAKSNPVELADGHLEK
jgi:nucleoside phosphorylase